MVLTAVRASHQVDKQGGELVPVGGFALPSHYQCIQFTCKQMYSTHCLHLRDANVWESLQKKLHSLSSDSQNHKIMWRIALHWLCNCFWKEVGVKTLSWARGLFCLVSRRVEWRGVVCLEMWSTFPPLFLMYILSCALLLHTFSTMCCHCWAPVPLYCSALFCGETPES